MPSQLITASSIAVLWASVPVVIGIGIHMAQPWGDNYAYQDASGYGRLALFLLFAIAPYIAMLLCLRLFAGADRIAAAFAFGAALIGVAGVAAYFATAFVHPDAQGGLIFLFMPVIQLVAGVALLMICVLWLRLARTPGAGK
jgi:hypothetical protein